MGSEVQIHENPSVCGPARRAGIPIFTQDLLETISGCQIHCQKATNTWGKHRGHAPESPVPVASILASTWWKPGSFWHRFLGRPCARICDLPDRYHGGRVVRWRAETVSC